MTAETRATAHGRTTGASRRTGGAPAARGPDGARAPARTGGGGGGGAARATAYDLAALAARCGLGWAFASHALRALESGTPPLLAYAELACAVALVTGLLAPVAGTGLAALAAAAVWPDLADPALAATAPACLLLAVNSGRLSADAVLRRALLRRRGTGIARPVGESKFTRRPEQAPPLPYAEESVSVGTSSGP